MESGLGVRIPVAGFGAKDGWGMGLRFSKWLQKISCARLLER